MDLNTLHAALSPTSKTPQQLAPYLPYVESAMAIADITTVRRAAAWFATIGEETGGFANFVELWGPTAQQRGYEGRADLGNHVAGDGYRFRGRGAIQLTGRANYRAFGQWCKEKGLVDDAEHFAKNPDLVATPKWGFLAAAKYWSTTVRRGKSINQWADEGDILAVSRCVNGWIDGAYPWGWPGRQSRWKTCLALGEALLPGGFLMAIDDAGQHKVLGAAIQTADPQVTDLEKGVIGPRPQRHTQFYNVDGNPSLAAKGKKLAYLRAMVMDLWNELVYDGYVAEVEDPALDEKRYGSPVRFITAIHKNVRQSFLLIKAIAEKVGVDTKAVLEPAPIIEEKK
ncbi:lysin A, glycosyl hydrolase domain [Gordonia phage Commandaria]|uniref:Lysin A, glycosyl hydrolase domain n=1 Tax=Gordonia phage Commandaria TaxID=3038364 RepID=A0AAF0GIH1_9CAUD|nr:lysin A, glycosyl hydrolase domain [Gordonia phage Commandaria]WGH20832.1 lysin A, glycosyl hydrolase domain [Gordonia phage Commandaria]